MHGPSDLVEVALAREAVVGPVGVDGAEHLATGGAHERAEAITAHNPFAGNRLGLDAPGVVDAAVDGRTVVVTYADGASNAFHHQWLRHSCYSEVSGNPADGIRFTTTISFGSDIAPTSVAAVDGDLAIVWNDGHSTGIYTFEYLRRWAEEDPV